MQSRCCEARNIAAPSEHLATLAANIRSVRVDVGLSQVKLAVAAGVDLSYLNEIENSKRDPSVTTLLKIARALGTTPAALLDGVE